MPFDFAYSTSKESYSYGTSSQPLGSLTWFGLQVGVEDNGESVPANFELSQNYPNPFNPETQIKYVIPEQEHVKLTIYNSTGQEIRTLVNNSQSAGSHTVTWNGRNNFGQKVTSGIYLYRLDAGDFVNIKKMILLK